MNQMLNLNESEMLALCKRVMNLEPCRRDCVVEREDGIDIDEWIMMRASSWYARLLMDGPLAWLPTQDIKDTVAVTNCGNGVVMAVYPSVFVRPVEWQLEGWHHSVSHFALPDDTIDMLQHNPWTRGGACNPVAVDHGNWMLLYSIDPQATPVLKMARCVTYPGTDRFVFHHAAIPTLEEALKQE